MKGRTRQTPAQRLLRVAPWGQVFAMEGAEGEPSRLVFELRVRTDVDAVLALADRWRNIQHPALLPVLTASVLPQVGGQPGVRIEQEAPRGSLLSNVAPKLRVPDERLVAALMIDLLHGLALLHARGLVAATVAPERLAICPPGIDDLPPLRLCEPGLPAFALEAGHDAAQVLPCLEVIAPEVLEGGTLSAASDLYATAATAAFLFLRQHVHAAETPALVADQARRGLQPAQIEALQDAAPTLGPILVRAMAVNAWARAGVLAELTTACERLVEGVPTFSWHNQTLVAPWAVRSPIIPLAAFASAMPYAEQFAPVQPLAMLTPNAPQALEAKAVDRARLNAALQRLEAERARAHAKTEARGRGVLAKFVILLVFILSCVVIVALGTRRTQRIREAMTVPTPKRASTPPVMPKPRTLMVTPSD